LSFSGYLFAVTHGSQDLVQTGGPIVDEMDKAKYSDRFYDSPLRGYGTIMMRSISIERDFRRNAGPDLERYSGCGQ